jgi:ATPase family associated with various cellular activities (AAA)/Winged helix domain, variant
MSVTPEPGAMHPAVRKLRAALADEFARLRARLAMPADTPAPHDPVPDSALEVLAQLFGLNDVERDILCLVAGAELEPGVTDAVRAVTGIDRADVALAVAISGERGWDALCPEGPLRRWRLIEPIGQGPMLRRPLAADERVLHFLMGLNYLDARLDGLVSHLPARRPLDERERAAEARLAAAWTSAGPVPVVLLAGRDEAARRDIAAAAAENAGLRLLRLFAADIPAEWTQRAALATYLDRELALSGGALFIECGDESHGDHAARLVDALGGPVVVAAIDPPAPQRVPRLRIDLPQPRPAERRAIWHEAIGARADGLGPGLDRLSEQFALDRSGIEMAVGAAVNGASIAPDRLFGRLWQSARLQARGRLDGLADRIESAATWDDLVLPGEQLAQLRDLAAHVDAAWRVNDDWGWRAKSPRGLGATALFAGPSGTGKTLAAEILSSALGLDLYRIDLSQVVSKYIGETEKNLARIFTAAEDGGAILLFDEADALFGKRSEVKDSHDRYANVEVSYLLQRMESYRGLAILTTNQKSALDQAFLRRLRHVVNFPFPDTAARAEIWARIFPLATPTRGLDPEKLARMNLAGGAIRSIALNASFLAAGSNGPVTPEHVLTAVRREYAKLDKPLSASELGALR